MNRIVLQKVSFVLLLVASLSVCLFSADGGGGGSSGGAGGATVISVDDLDQFYLLGRSIIYGRNQANVVIKAKEVEGLHDSFEELIDRVPALLNTPISFNRDRGGEKNVLLVHAIKHSNLRLIEFALERHGHNIATNWDELVIAAYKNRTQKIRQMFSYLDKKTSPAALGALVKKVISTSEYVCLDLKPILELNKVNLNELLMDPANGRSDAPAGVAPILSCCIQWMATDSLVSRPKWETIIALLVEYGADPCVKCPCNLLGGQKVSLIDFVSSPRWSKHFSSDFKAKIKKIFNERYSPEALRFSAARSAWCGAVVRSVVRRRELRSVADAGGESTAMVVYSPPSVEDKARFFRLFKELCVARETENLPDLIKLIDDYPLLLRTKEALSSSDIARYPLTHLVMRERVGPVKCFFEKIIDRGIATNDPVLKESIAQATNSSVKSIYDCFTSLLEQAEPSVYKEAFMIAILNEKSGDNPTYEKVLRKLIASGKIDLNGLLIPEPSGVRLSLLTYFCARKRLHPLVSDLLEYGADFSCTSCFRFDIGSTRHQSQTTFVDLLKDSSFQAYCGPALITEWLETIACKERCSELRRAFLSAVVRARAVRSAGGAASVSRTSSKRRK